MEMTIENFETVFFVRQKRLFDALERQAKVYEKYIPDLPVWPQIHKWDFNLIYDLQWRIKERIIELQSKYYDFHWDKYKFNAY